MLSGVKFLPPSVDLNTWLVAVNDTFFALSPLSPLSPFVPCLEHDQEKVLLNVFPSIVIGIMKLPPSAARAVFVDTAKLTLEDVLLTVIPLTLLTVPIV